MKILHLIYDHMENPWVGGGGAVRAYELNRRLAARGHEVTTVSGAWQGARDYEEDGRLRFVFLGSRKGGYIKSTFAYAFAAARYVRRHGAAFDLVVEEFAPWNPVMSRWLTATPAIIHVNHREGRGIIQRWKLLGIPFFLIEKYYPRLFRHVTVLSEGTGEKLGLPGARIVPAGIGADTLRWAEEEGEPRREEDFVLYVGRIAEKNKGLDTLLEAIKTLEEVPLWLAGRGRDEERLRSRAAELGISSRVRFLGFISEEEKLDLLRRCRIFALPSRFEGWGIVALEAAACGAPAVVSDIRELGFAVEYGFGRSFKTADATDLARVLGDLIADEESRRQMSRRAVECARKHTWEMISLDYEQYLESIKEKHGRGAASGN